MRLILPGAVETKPPKGTCRENRYHVIRTGRGFISGSVPDASPSDPSCIFVFTIPNGQRLNLTLIDFNRSLGDDRPRDITLRGDHPLSDHQGRDHTRGDLPPKSLSPGDHPMRDHSPGDHPLRDRTRGDLPRNVCRQYAVVKEPATGLSVSVCGGGQARERHVYMSRSSLVHLQLASWQQVTTSADQQQTFTIAPAKYLLRYEGRWNGIPVKS